jgi:hypothetical protein
MSYLLVQRNSLAQTSPLSIELTSKNVNIEELCHFNRWLAKS